jgi:hypothetical protein
VLALSPNPDPLVEFVQINGPGESVQYAARLSEGHLLRWRRRQLRRRLNSSLGVRCGLLTLPHRAVQMVRRGARSAFEALRVVAHGDYMHEYRTRPARHVDRNSTGSRTANVPAAHLLLSLQKSAGNNAVQRLVAHESVAQRYRNASATNFGAADSLLFVEKTFDDKSPDTQPWIEQITVNFHSVIKDANGVKIPWGTLTATYFQNPHALTFLPVDVTGGPVNMPADAGEFTVQRIEGVGFNDPEAAAKIEREQGKKALEGPIQEGPKGVKRRRYTKSGPGQKWFNVSASMHLAVFYNEGEALHSGDPVASHGCVHMANVLRMIQLNYHSVIGKTKVTVGYSGEAQKLLAPAARERQSVPHGVAVDWSGHAPPGVRGYCPG